MGQSLDGVWLCSISCYWFLCPKAEQTINMLFILWLTQMAPTWYHSKSALRSMKGSLKFALLCVNRVERELTRWQPEGPFIDPGLSEGPARFGRPTAGSVTGWDQFEVNRERFQVGSSAAILQQPFTGQPCHCALHVHVGCSPACEWVLWSAVSSHGHFLS